MSNKENITILEPSRCTGCGVCENSCPVQAISVREDTEGFRMPFVDEAKCIGCKMCVKVCPVLSLKKKNAVKPNMYAVRASDEIRAISSSGGVFSLLAAYILNLGGSVCGAAFDENMQLRHVIVEKQEDLAPLRGSKYLQSDTGNIYIQVKEKLKEGKPVLFVGTPCQVAAIKNFAGENENLYTADILCHGVPSQKSFNNYLQDAANGKRVIGVDFRNKKFGWNCEHLLINFEDDSFFQQSLKEGNAYVRAFLRNIDLRRSCEDCPFANFPRHGDISIGDFWGIRAFDAEQNDGKGTSIVFENNKKGNELLNKAIFPAAKVKQFPFSDKMPNRIHSYFKANDKRDRFLMLLQKYNFTEAMRRFMKNKFDIGLVSNFYAVNFGGSLTQFALYNVLQDMGYSVLMIERPASAQGIIPEKVREICYEKWPYPEYSLAKQYPTKEAMRDLNDYCDSFVVGSDQLFQNSLFNALGGIYTLDWVANTKRKIAYAASFGFDYVWGDPKQIAEMGYFMQQFDAFSVREDSGVRVAKDSFGVEAVHVLDPVFLCDTKHYDELISHVSRKKEGEYISSYILDPNDEKNKMLAVLHEKLNMRVEVFSEMGNRKSDAFYPEFDYAALKVEGRLQSIKNAKFFLCDSFHGTCLAIIYNIPFISVVNRQRGGARFGSLLRYFGLENRMVETFEDFQTRPELLEPIDFKPVNEKLQKGREFGLQWLKEALQKEPKKGASIYDILVDRLAERDREIETLRKMVKQLYRDKNKLAYTKSIGDYLEEAEITKKNCIYIVAVKDTPGLNVTPELAKQLQQSLGIRQDMFQKHWKSYLAVVDGGNCLYEELSDDKIEKEMTVGGHNLQLASAALKVGNIAKIVVDGVDHALNRRGFNIVAIDKQERTVCDSACLDLHPKLYTLLHKDLF